MVKFQPVELYRGDKIRALEAIASEKYDISEQQLMDKAGLAAYRVLQGSWVDIERIAVLCGPGNNGGDGYVLARMAKLDGVEASVFYLGDPEVLKGAAMAAFEACKSAGVTIGPFDSKIDLDEYDLLVDGILGTGIDRDVSGVFLEAIDEINEVDTPVLSLDIPSGLDTDTGYIHGNAVVADLTVTFIGAKQGLYTGAGIDCCGEVVVDDLDISEDAFLDIEENAFLLNIDDLVGCLGERPRNAHKGDYGHVLVVGGNYGMPGAVRMAAEAAYRVGAGLVSVATRPEHVSVVSGVRPEIMCHGITVVNDLEPLLERATVIVIGPGLGRDEWAQSLFQHCIDADKPLVVDADGLNLLAKNPQSKDHWILTPHPGEGSRLLGMSIEAIGRDRFAAVHGLQEKYSGVVVLKGSGSLVLGPGPDQAVAVCHAGNPGMASGGMGDVLSGILAGLVAQGLSTDMAAQAGVLVHGMVADLAAELGERGLLATDLLPYIRDVVNKL